MQISNELRVGIMFIVGLVLLILMVVTLTRWGQDRNTYGFTIRFAQAQGILEGAEVRVAGVEVGRVASVGYDQEAKQAVVAVRVKRRVKLYQHYTYTIGAGGLVGERYVEITPIAGDSEQIQDGDTDVVGKCTPSMDDAIAQADQLMRKFSKTADSLNNLIGDEETQRNLKLAIADLRLSATQALEFSRGMNQIILRNQQSVDQMVADLAAVSSDARRVSESLSSQLTDTTMIRNLEIATENAVQITQRLEGIARSVDTLVSDEEMSRNLRESVTHMKQASADLELMMTEARDAVAVLPKVTSNLEKASADLPEITKPFREIAPDTAKDVQHIAAQIRGASDEVSAVAEQVADIGRALKLSDIEPDLREMALASGPENTRLDLNLDVRGPKTMMRLGMADLGKENDANVQFGTKMGDNIWMRYGVVQSRFGLGADYFAGPDLRLSAELFDPDNIRANALLDYRLRFLGPEWWLSTGAYDIFDHNTFGAGVTFRP